MGALVALEVLDGLGGGVVSLTEGDGPVAAGPGSSSPRLFTTTNPATVPISTAAASPATQATQPGRPGSSRRSRRSSWPIRVVIRSYPSSEGRTMSASLCRVARSRCARGSDASSASRVEGERV